MTGSEYAIVTRLKGFGIVNWSHVPSRHALSTDTPTTMTGALARRAAIRTPGANERAGQRDMRLMGCTAIGELSRETDQRSTRAP